MCQLKYSRGGRQLSVSEDLWFNENNLRLRTIHLTGMLQVYRPYCCTAESFKH